MAEYSKQLAAQVEAYLESRNWQFDFDPEKGLFRFRMRLPNRMSNCSMAIIAGEDTIRTYATAPVTASMDARPAAANYITRVNFGLNLGNFEMDWRDGELRYKCAHFCGGGVPAPDALERVVDIPFLMWRRYGDGLLNVLFAGADPAQEIAKIDG